MGRVKRGLLFSLGLLLSLGAMLSGTQAVSEKQPPTDVSDGKQPPTDVFFMKTEYAAPRGVAVGAEFTVNIVCGLNPGQEGTLGSFQFTLDFPEDQVELVELERNSNVLPGDHVVIQGQKMAYNCNSNTGLTLKGQSTRLATARFQVRENATEKRVTIGLKDAEITRPQDMQSSLDQADRSVQVPINGTPVMELSQPGPDGTVTLTFHNNLPGKLIAAVYGAGGRILRTVTQDVEGSQSPIKLPMDLTGGTQVKAFLMDAGTWAPLCKAAELGLTS